MLRTVAVVLLLWGMVAQTASAQLQSEGLIALGEVNAAFDKVVGFQAEVDIAEATNPNAPPSTVSLTISKDLGWKVRSFNPQQSYELTCNFQTFWQYLPTEQKVLLSKADSPDAAKLFRKPVDDINPLKLLDPSTLQYKGKVQFQGQTVHHFQGSTTTQLLLEGAPVKTEMEAWVSPADGLPRKTVEKTPQGTGTTVMRNIVLNPSLTEADFTFTPPPGVEVIDMSAGAQSVPPGGVTQGGGLNQSVPPPTSN